MTSTSPSTAPVSVGGRFISVYALAFFGVWMALLTPPILTLALRVAELDPAHKEASLSWILGVGAVVALLANPIAGFFSDRTTARMGMRRPWLLGGMVVGLAGLYMMATGGLTVILLGWCVCQLGFNALLAAIVAVLPDQVPEAQRGKVSGVLGICVQVGIVAGVVIGQAVSGSMFLMFMLPGLIALVLVLLMTATLKDRRLSKGEVPPLDLLGFFKSFWIDPRKAPDFAWAFASRFMLFMGLATLVTYQVYYLIDKLHFAADKVPGAMLTSTLITTATTVFGSLASGWLSDRLQRRKVFVLVAALIYAVGMAVIGIASGFTAFLVGIGVCGLGQGVYLAVDLALVTEVLPNKESDAAKDLGIFNLASALPQSVAPAVAPLFLAIGSSSGGNYGSLFIAAAAFAAIGALAIIPIKAVR